MTLFDNCKGCPAVYTAAIGAFIKNKIYNKNPPFLWAAHKRRVKGGRGKFYFLCSAGPRGLWVLFCPREKDVKTSEPFVFCPAENKKAAHAARLFPVPFKNAYLYSNLTNLYLRGPLGSWASNSSPSLCPNTPLANGLLTDSRPFSGLDSMDPTRV